MGSSDCSGCSGGGMTGSDLIVWEVVIILVVVVWMMVVLVVCWCRWWLL